MSKNVVIQEGGTNKQLTVNKLKTNLADGSTQLWLPESEVSLGNKNITANGTYYASSDGYYGFEYVTVHGIGIGGGSPTGPHPTDGDGDQVISEPVPRPEEEGGGYELETKKVPSSIRITTPPTRVEYTDGDLIDFSGMVVKAYKMATGLFTDERYPDGIIPNSELDFPVKVATNPIISFINSLMPVRPGGEVFFRRGMPELGFSELEDDAIYVRNVNETDNIYLCTLFDVARNVYYLGVFSMTPSAWEDVQYRGGNIIHVGYHSVRDRTYLPMFYFPDSAAYSDSRSKFGSMPDVRTDRVPSQSASPIPVQWLSPYTGETFVDSFTITVNAADGDDGDGDDGSDGGNDGGVDAVTGADPVAGGETP